VRPPNPPRVRVDLDTIDDMVSRAREETRRSLEKLERHTQELQRQQEELQRQLR
jgi:hypothetical protein